MIDIGEDLVGAYLSRVEECDIVQFNVRTGVKQAEIDVVGMKVSHAYVDHIWLCEVSTHTGGLGGYGGDAAGKIQKKIASVKGYADRTYPGIPRTIEVWSPKVTPAVMTRVTEALGADSDVALVANHEYSARVRALAKCARREKSYSDSPAFRLLQILTRLPDEPLARD